MFKRIAILAALTLALFTLTGCLQQKETQPTYAYYELPITHVIISDPFETIGKSSIEKLHLHHTTLIIYLKDGTTRIVQEGNYRYV